jgi:hypothetical protein
MNKIPSMPSFKANSLPGESDTLPVEENSNNMLESSEENEGSFEKLKPKLATVENSLSNAIEIQCPRSGIKVVALRDGFMFQQRIKAGEEFTISNFSQLGSWMKCLDPMMERKRKEIEKAKK